MDKHIRYKTKLFFLKVIGETNFQEEKELEALLQKKKSYRRLLTDLTDPEEYKSRLEQLRRIDTEHELEYFMAERQTPVHKIRHIYRRVAAVIIPLLIGSVVAWQMLSKVPADHGILQTHRISSGATLILSDGTKQPLSPAPRLLTEINGAQIQTDSNQLNYTGSTALHDTTLIYNHLSVGRGFEYMLILADGTKVWMNSESEIHYPVYFTSHIRKVCLQGEAYFEVAKDVTRPFIVEVNNGFEVKVLGTHFNIKAYPTDEHSETTLLEGKIAISAPSLKESIILSPSQQMVFRKDGENEVRKVNPEYAVAWHNGWFYFDNETLEKAVEQIGRWYNTDFVFDDPECRHIRVSGKVKRFTNLQVILNMLNTTTNCNYKIEKQKIHITKK